MTLGTGQQIKLTVCGSGVLRVYAAAATDESVPFLSRCRACGHPRLQVGYSRERLVRKLVAGVQIDAYCLACDCIWPITARERAWVARGLAGLRSACGR